MRRIFFIHAFIILTVLSYGQTAELDSILALHFKKVGGSKNWEQLKSCYLEQAYFVIPVYLEPEKRSFLDHRSGLKKTYYQDSNHIRFEFHIEGKISTTFITNPRETKGYIYSNKHEPPLSETFRQSMKKDFLIYQIGLTPLLLDAYRENNVYYQGEAESYGKQCYQLIIENERIVKGQLMIYIDKDTYLIHAMKSILTPDKYKIYTDYRDVEGLILPHNVSSYSEEGRYDEYKILNVTINQDIDELLFEVW